VVLSVHALTGGGTYRLEAPYVGTGTLSIGRHIIELDLDQRDHL
jgi:hypothetical protein